MPEHDAPNRMSADTMPFVLLDYFHGGGMVGGLTHMIVASVINGLIFGVIWRVLSHLSLPEMLLLVAVVIGGAYMWARNRDRQRW